MKRTNLIAALMMMNGLAMAQEIDGMALPAAAPSRQTAAKAKSRAKSYRDLVARPAASLSLGELTNVEKARLNGARNTVALNRLVSREMAAGGTWDFGPDGTRVWRLKVVSFGASALRAHFAGFDARDGQLVIYGADNEVLGPYAGKGEYQDGDVWTDLVTGDSMTIEYQTADDSSAIPFESVKVSHFVQSAAGTAVRKAFLEIPQTPTFRGAFGFDDPDSCHIDAKCAPEQWQPMLNAFAVYFIDHGDSMGTCTGTMMNNVKGTGRPYFLTANHCVAKAAEARSVMVLWNYQSSRCNGPEVDWRQLPRTNGTRLLVTGGMAQGDFTLLLLSQNPPADTYYAGWNSSETALEVDTQAVGLHHPSGSFKRVSVGQRIPDAKQQFDDETTLPKGKYHIVRWQRGVTAGGSSGSGLFNTKGHLVGTLTGGGSYCDRQTEPDFYGKFSGYFEHLKRYLVDDNI